MESIYFTAAFWLFAAVVSTIIANRLKISMALMEIIVGAGIGFLAYQLNFTDRLALQDDWLKFIDGIHRRGGHSQRGDSHTDRQ